ncbi:MAG: M20 family metallo-hydrolase [Treponema berlinense]|uniref:M20 family metallo-hydrolase n=1 Tax=Treponema berlinense TaxID=225004 RepID=UPI002A823962|nr:M20 family metallo-hydrolase [Treponema berlinense]MDY3706978.1 M20 family metallo-hydrolase [Treponema berlinense]
MNENFELLKENLEKTRPEIIELQTLLSSIPAMAPESGGDGESKKCTALKNWLIGRGFKENQFKQFDAPDSRVSSGVRPNLMLTIPGKKEQSIFVMAHMDVVPPGNLSLWHSDPWKVVYDEKNDKITGRGVEDNQQGLVSGVLAALELIKNNIVPEYTVKLFFMADEEFGSEYGMKFLLKEHLDLFKKDDLILIPDGGDPEGKTIEVAEKNILWLRLHTIGLQSHGSMPQKGKNAHLAACDLALRLNDLENFFDAEDELFSPSKSTFQPTKKETNVDTVNIIPGDDVFYMDCRILPCYTLDVVRAEIKKRVAEIEEKYGVKVEISEPQKSQSPATPVNAPVVEKLKQAIMDAHGKEAVPIGIGGGTVGAELRNLGFNAAIWSTIDEVCHQPDEYSYLHNTIADAQTLCALFLQK